MRTTFLNDNSERNLEKKGLSSLENTGEIISGYMHYGTDEEGGVDHLNGDRQEKVREFFEDYGSFYDYGLCVDYVAPGEDGEGFLRYQLSTGGPGDEIRFYYSPGSWSAHRIEYVYLDWFCGVGFDVTGEDWAQWLNQWFEDTDTARTEYEKEMALG